MLGEEQWVTSCRAGSARGKGLNTSESLALGITHRAVRDTEQLTGASHWAGPSQPGSISLSLVTQ